MAIERVLSTISGIQTRIKEVFLPSLEQEKPARRSRRGSTYNEEFQQRLASMQTFLSEFMASPTDTALTRLTISSRSLIDQVTFPARKNVSNLETAARATMEAETQVLGTAATASLSPDSRNRALETLAICLVGYHHIFQSIDLEDRNPTRERLIEIASDRNHPMMLVVLRALKGRDVHILDQAYLRLLPSLQDPQRRFLFSEQNQQILDIFLSHDAEVREILEGCLEALENIEAAQFTEDRSEVQLLSRHYQRLDMLRLKRVTDLLIKLADEDRLKAVSIVQSHFASLAEEMALCTGDDRFYPEGVVLRRNLAAFVKAYKSLSPDGGHVLLKDVAIQSGLSEDEIGQLIIKYYPTIRIGSSPEGYPLVKIGNI